VLGNTRDIRALKAWGKKLLLNLLLWVLMVLNLFPDGKMEQALCTQHFSKMGIEGRDDPLSYAIRTMHSETCSPVKLRHVVSATGWQFFRDHSVAQDYVKDARSLGCCLSQ